MKKTKSRRPSVALAKEGNSPSISKVVLRCFLFIVFRSLFVTFVNVRLCLLTRLLNYSLSIGIIEKLNYLSLFLNPDWQIILVPRNKSFPVIN